MAQPHPDYDVYRNKQGEPITLNNDEVAAAAKSLDELEELLGEEKVTAIFHALDIVKKLREEAGNDDPLRVLDIPKSRLLGRMLIDGRPPLDEMPPMWQGARGYHLVEPGLEHAYFADSFPDIPGTGLATPTASTQ